ncbi:DNA-binding response OmpR family regulator [Pedobacter sp. AK017]|uniref:response regulator transcription factor n=1 Tax=Pedobacter sp. AK017 TaxID=2723073 RepID=UPI0016184D11|nr:response regulator transcription factor [Pedobacter sp. AK017]MBB5438970.1 DNA-binding response OmpR family regulator [Pedobacter sp. AK017]
MKLLLVEDEPVLVEEMEQYFRSHGFSCDQAVTFSQAEDKILNSRYDVVVLDITLPDGTGMDLIADIRQRDAETGIVILSARNSLSDKLEGLDLGADDYLTKPFFLEELSARINALYRRKTLRGTVEILFDDFTIEPLAKLFFYLGEPVSLTKKEFEMLVYFVVNKNRVLSKASISEHLWGDHFDQHVNFDTLYMHLTNLRKKLTRLSGKHYIKTVYGIGYKFTC